jgi:hypothetical protein
MIHYRFASHGAAITLPISGPTIRLSIRLDAQYIIALERALIFSHVSLLSRKNPRSTNFVESYQSSVENIDGQTIPRGPAATKVAV